MKFVLILFVVLDSPINAGVWGSVATAEFDSQAACQKAAEAFKQMRISLVRDTKAMAACMPKGDA